MQTCGSRSLVPSAAGKRQACSSWAYSHSSPQHRKYDLDTHPGGISAVYRKPGQRPSQPCSLKALPEHQAAARSRLKGLLAKLEEEDEDEALLEALEDAQPEFKLLMTLGSGSILTAVAFLLCSLTNSDPLGGLRLLSPDTWAAAGTGLAIGAPWALLRGLSWTSQVQRMVPVLRSVKEDELRNLQPLLSSLTIAQVAAVAAIDVVPEVLLLLPAAQGGLTRSFGVYASMLRSQMMGLTDLLPFARSEQLPSLLAIAMTASLCGLAHYNTTATSGDQYEVVESAIRSADRYYRVLSMQPNAPPNCAEQMSSAFKSVATAWMQQQRAAGIFHLVSKAVDIVLLCVLWRATGNLAAPLVAALLVQYADVAAVYRQLDSHGTTELQQ